MADDSELPEIDGATHLPKSARKKMWEIWAGPNMGPKGPGPRDLVKA